MAGLEATGGHHIHLLSQLELEKAEGPLQYEVGAVVQRLKRRLDRVPADQHVAGAEQVVWQLGRPRLAVVRRGAWLATGEDLLEFVQEGCRRRFRLSEELARENRLGAKNGLGRGVGAV
jgi:hypothetical protein